MTPRRALVLAYAQGLIARGERLSPTRISKALMLTDHKAAIRIVNDLRLMGKLPPGEAPAGRAPPRSDRPTPG